MLLGPVLRNKQAGKDTGFEDTQAALEVEGVSDFGGVSQR